MFNRRRAFGPVVKLGGAHSRRPLLLVARQGRGRGYGKIGGGARGVGGGEGEGRRGSVEGRDHASSNGALLGEGGESTHTEAEARGVVHLARELDVVLRQPLALVVFHVVSALLGHFDAMMH